MTTLTANILAEGQLVQLDLGGKTQVVPCRVLGFGGTTVVLAAIAAPVGETLEALQPEAAAYVIVDGTVQLHALRARVLAAASPEEIVVSVTDDFTLGQRRRYSRAPLAIGARLRPSAGGEEWETVTRDISAGGLRVVRTGAAGEEGDAVAFVLEAAQAGLRVAGEAEVVRRTAADLSLRFTAIDEDAVRLLQQLSIAYYRFA